MINLSPKQIAEYFHDCYAKIDGLWFIKTEERFGFETSLDIDEDVWKIVPKIQSRLLKKMSGMSQGMDALCECLTTKLDIEGFQFQSEKAEDGKSLTIHIRECPWHNRMIKSGRESLSCSVGRRICFSEYSVWASEFDRRICFSLENTLCGGSQICELVFFMPCEKKPGKDGK